MTTVLERKFLGFLSQLPGSESLDVLLHGPAYTGERRADFLLFDRKIVVEVKSLETDTSYKAKSELDRHRDRLDFPVFYGGVEIDKLLSQLPDGQDIRDRIFERVTRPVEEAVRSAEKQITNTMRLFDLQDSAGIVVFLNEDIDIFSPPLVVDCLSQKLLRLDRFGALRTSVACAWLIFESHSVTDGPSAKNFPMIALESALVDDLPWLPELIRYLQFAWAQYNGRPLVQGIDLNFNDLNISSSKSQEAVSDEPQTRQEFWQQDYKQHPYLRNLSDADVLRFGREVSDHLLSYFLKDGSRAPHESLEPLWVRWSDFLCEAEYRSLNLQKMRNA